jgi:hypothetical protein
MRSIWHSLAWKEWHEHKWKLAAVLAVMWSIMAFVAFVIGREERHAIAESFQVCMLLGGIPLAVFIGLGIAAGERSRGTLDFVQALPIPMWRLALHKLAFALLTVIVPVFLTMIAIIVGTLLLRSFGLSIDFRVPQESLSRRPFSSGSWFIDTAITASLAAASLVIWSAALGVNRKDEVSAGAFALLLMALWWAVLFAIWVVLLKAGVGPETARLRAVGVGSAPLGVLGLVDDFQLDTVGILVAYATAITVHIAMAARYVTRFGRTDDREIRSPKTAAADLRFADFLPSPRRFQLSAIAWKQARETGPIALAGLAAILVIVACFCLTILVINGALFDRVGTVYAYIAMIFGLFIALIAGIGVVLNDGAPGLNTFWRSRAIQPDLWFWTKFIVGLLIVIAVVYMPIAFIVAIDTSLFTRLMNDPDTSWVVPLMLLAIFAAAVMVTCFVRHAVYAAILSIAVVYLGLVITWGGFKLAAFLEWIQWPGDRLRDSNNVMIMTGSCITFVVCTIFAWLATRYDWGRKRV